MVQIAPHVSQQRLLLRGVLVEHALGHIGCVWGKGRNVAKNVVEECMSFCCKRNTVRESNASTKENCGCVARVDSRGEAHVKATARRGNSIDCTGKPGGWRRCPIVSTLNHFGWKLRNRRGRRFSLAQPPTHRRGSLFHIDGWRCCEQGQG